MDLSKKVLPACVTVGGEQYKIKTDYRFYIELWRLLKNKEQDLTVYDFLYIDEKPADRAAGFNEILKFYAPERKLPRQTGDDRKDPVIDYDVDADLIYSAFMREYKIDLITTDLHWHKFLALLAGLKDSKLTDVIGFRLYENKSGRDDEYNKHLEELKEAWELDSDNVIEATDKEIADALAKYNAWERGERK